MNAEDWATALSGIENAVAVPERAQFPRGPYGSGAPQNARHAVRVAIRARHSGCIDEKSAVRTAAAMRRLFNPTRNDVLVEAFAMARSCQDTSWPLILRKKPTPQVRGPMGRWLSTITRAANTVRAIKLVELKTTPLDGAGLIADETEQHAPVLIAPALANYKDEVTFHSTFYAVPHRVIGKLKAQPPQEKKT